MTNRFGVVLRPEDVRWAAAEGVSETVIAAVLLLHEHSVDEIVPELSAAELEQVITLVGRSPRLYAPGMLDALNQRRSLRAPAPPVASPLPKAKASVTPHYPHQRDKGPSPGVKPAELKTGAKYEKTGTRSGTRNETARRRLTVEDLMRPGLSVRMISDATDIPRSSVHRAMRAIARAEARKELAIAEIATELLGKKLSTAGDGEHEPQEAR